MKYPCSEKWLYLLGFLPLQRLYISFWDQWICPVESPEHFRFELPRLDKVLGLFEEKIPHSFSSPSCLHTYFSISLSGPPSSDFNIIICSPFFLRRDPYHNQFKCQVWWHFVLVIFDFCVINCRHKYFSIVSQAFVIRICTKNTSQIPTKPILPCQNV